jgi:hypothetical protein
MASSTHKYTLGGNPDFSKDEIPHPKSRKQAGLVETHPSHHHLQEFRHNVVAASPGAM